MTKSRVAPIVQRRNSDAAFTIRLTTQEVGLLRHILTRALENPEHVGLTNDLDRLTKATFMKSVERMRNLLVPVWNSPTTPNRGQ